MGQITKNGIADEVSGTAVINQAKAVASHLGAEASTVATNQLAQRGQQSANELTDAAHALREARKQLPGNMAAPYIEMAADQIDRASHFVRTASPKDVGAAVENIARKEPLLFLGGAFALGLLGARFLKSSAQRSVESNTEQPIREPADRAIGRDGLDGKSERS
jgi:hypothetical protein